MAIQPNAEKKTPHPHAEAIRKWLDDVNQPVWAWDGSRWCVSNGTELSYPAHLQGFTKGPFAVGPMPTEPPVRMCTLAGVEFPEPMREAPGKDQICYLPALAPASEEPSAIIVRGGDDFAQRGHKRGFLHKTEAGAIAQCKAIHEALRQAIEAAK